MYTVDQAPGEILKRTAWVLESAADREPDANAFASLLELQAPSVHNAPHLFMGGTQIDVTFSAQDPWFFFHHAMVDFLFAVWQSVDLDKRITTLPDARIFDEMRAQGCK